MHRLLKVLAALITALMLFGSSAIAIAADRDRKCEQQIHKAEDTCTRPFVNMGNTAARRSINAISLKKPESAVMAEITIMTTTATRPLDFFGSNGRPGVLAWFSLCAQNELF